MIQPGLFDMENRLESLSKFSDPLEKLKEVVDFEVFCTEIEEGLDFSDRTKGRRPPYEAILIIKILVLQTLYFLRNLHMIFSLQQKEKNFVCFLNYSLKKWKNVFLF